MKLIRLLPVALLIVGGGAVAQGQETAPPPTFLEQEHFFRKDTTNKVEPEYPAEAQEAGIQGMVLVFVVVDKDGKVAEVKPLISPHEMLSEAVIKAVKEWRMPAKPYQAAPDGINWGELRFIFSLKDGKAEVLEAPDEEQRKVSKEFFSERMRREKKAP
jgi:TonB family protein